MIKKFVSNALLSVFVDKKARKAMNTKQDAKTDKNTDDVPAPHPEQLAQPEPDPLTDMDQDEITALIRDSLNAAEKEIIDKKQKHTANPGRQALINEAMAIHKSKKHIVDELPEEQRQKLLLMAQQALGAQLKD